MGRKKPDVLFIQETKIQKMIETVVNQIWGFDECCWSVNEAVGRSGGILIIWRKETFVPVPSFQGKGFLGIQGIVKGKFLYLINLYSPCNLEDKQVLWDGI